MPIWPGSPRSSAAVEGKSWPAPSRRDGKGLTTAGPWQRLDADPGPAVRNVSGDRRIPRLHLVLAGRPQPPRTRGRGRSEIPGARGPPGDDAPRGESRPRGIGSDSPGRRRGSAPSSRERGRAMIEVRRARIDLDAVVDSVRRDDAGAIVLFVGTVRSDERVRALDYEVYRPMAIKSLTGLAERAKAKFGLTDLSIVPRLRPGPGRREFLLNSRAPGPPLGSLP